MGGYKVVLDGKHFGYISKCRGFFVDSDSLGGYCQVTPTQLREIAAMVEGVQDTKIGADDAAAQLLELVDGKR